MQAGRGQFSVLICMTTKAHSLTVAVSLFFCTHKRSRRPIAGRFFPMLSGCGQRVWNRITILSIAGIVPAALRHIPADTGGGDAADGIAQSDRGGGKPA